jgi:hypothetical protein
MKTISEPAREVPVIREVDVCVIGGGPGGLPAAWQAARHGAKTLLVEHYGFLGGMATAGMVGPILGLKDRAPEPCVGGITKEFCEAMAAIGGAVPWDEAMKTWGLGFDVEAYKVTADRLCQKLGVDVLLHSSATACVVADNQLQAVIIESKSGRQAIVAKCFVDATGDADLAFRAGAACTKGRPADGRMMSMGSFFQMGGMAGVTGEQRQQVAALMAQPVEEGDFVVYGKGVGGQGSVLQADRTSVNMTRFAGDATDVEDLTRGEMYLRDQVWRIVNFWREHCPGMENTYLAATAPHAGLRETRQLVGVQRVTGADVVAGRKRDDAVARCTYWIDIHCPRGLVRNGVHLCMQSCPQSDCPMITGHLAELPDELYPPDWFDIPYDALVPEQLDNLLVSGRCLSADYQAMAATRVMGPCMAIGEACGVAAAMATDAGIAPRAVDVPGLREKLQAAGAVV